MRFSYRKWSSVSRFVDNAHAQQHINRTDQQLSNNPPARASCQPNFIDTLVTSRNCQ